MCINCAARICSFASSGQEVSVARGRINPYLSTMNATLLTDPVQADATRLNGFMIIHSDRDDVSRMSVWVSHSEPRSGV